MHITGSFTADNKVYDGNNSATVLTRSLTGVTVGGHVSLTGGTATFSDKNVGNGKTVTLTGASLSGSGCGQLRAGLGGDDHGEHQQGRRDGRGHALQRDV